MKKSAATKGAAPMRFTATLVKPVASAKINGLVLLLPKNVSAKFSSRGMTTIEGSMNGVAFRTTVRPDGQKSHWMTVDKKLSAAAKAKAGDTVDMEVAPAEQQDEPVVPADLKKALAASPKAKALWSQITLIGRRDWVQWVETAKQAETRARRVKNACSMLAGGKRNVCCFDRSGYFDKSCSFPGQTE